MIIETPGVNLSPSETNGRIVAPGREADNSVRAMNEILEATF